MFVFKAIFLETIKKFLSAMTSLFQNELFCWLGVLCGLYILFKLCTSFKDFLRIYVFSTFPNFTKFGKWSVVTGATDGIGKSVAFQLASLGQNIVLISRNEDKLKKVASDLEFQHGIQTKYICVDFSHEESIYEEIEVGLKGLDIGVLVNNAGMGVGPYNFVKIPNISKCLHDITKVNMLSIYKMQQVVLPGMLERKRGLIVNVSSLSAVVPMKYVSVYGATKSFVNYFSNALNLECSPLGVTIQSCLPGFVSTNMTHHRKPSLFTLTADGYASSLVATFGKCPTTYGCWQHALQAYFLRTLPEALTNFVISNLQTQRQKRLKLQ